MGTIENAVINADAIKAYAFKNRNALTTVETNATYVG